MRYPINYRSAVLALLAFAFSTTIAYGQTYSGQASVARATVNVVGQRVITTGIADTGELPNAGGNISLTTAAVSVPGLPPTVPSPLSVGASTSESSGSAGVSQSQASVANVNINLLTNAITATAVSSNTNAGCPSEVLSGGSSVTGLQINSVGVTVLGTPNQIVQLLVAGNPVGTLIINEEIVGTRTITRNALHAFVTDPNDGTTIEVIVGASRSGINCGTVPIPNLFSGRGTSLRLRQAGVTDVSTILADTGALPPPGGSINAATANVNLGSGILSGVTVSTTAVASATSGGIPGGNTNTSQSNSAVDNLGIDLLAGTVTINATVLSSDTLCTCTLGVPSCTGSSTITGLAVNVLGLPATVNVTGAENQVVNIPVGILGSITLTLNGRSSATANASDITAFPLRVQTSLAGLVATDVVISNSHSDIVCGLAPTAAPVSLSGRVTDGSGRGLPSVVVTITDGQGFAKSARTNSFGFYSIKGIPAGESYIVGASARGHRFPPRFVSLTESVSGFDLSPESERLMFGGKTSLRTK